MRAAVLMTAVLAGALTVGALLPAGDAAPYIPQQVAGAAWAVWVLSVLHPRIRPAATAGRHGRKYLWLWFLAVVAVAWAILAEARPYLRAGSGLKAQYYASTSCSGLPVYAGVDPVPSITQVRRRRPRRLGEPFCVVWTGYISVPAPQDYDFVLRSDDGSGLQIDGHLIVDHAGVQGATEKSGKAHLTRGSHRVRLEYTQFGGDLDLRWLWSRGRAQPKVVPAWALSQRPVNYGSVVVARLFAIANRVLGIAVLVSLTCYLVVALSLPSKVRAWVGRISAASSGHPDNVSLAVAVTAYIAILLVPWPDGGQQRMFDAVKSTIVHLTTGAFYAFQHSDAFWENINRPGAGYNVLPSDVREMIAILRQHQIDTYDISEAIAANTWTMQQVVTAAWPRKRESDAKNRFLYNQETVPRGCSVIDKRIEVSLVRCP